MRLDLVPRSLGRDVWQLGLTGHAGDHTDFDSRLLSVNETAMPRFLAYVSLETKSGASRSKAAERLWDKCGRNYRPKSNL